MSWDDEGFTHYVFDPETAEKLLGAGISTSPTEFFDETQQLPLIQAAVLTGADDLRIARKREIDKKHRNKLKQERIDNKRKLGDLLKENEYLQEENTSMKNNEFEVKQQLESQADAMRQLKKQCCKLQSELDRQNTVVDVVSKRLAFSKETNLYQENENLKTENALLKAQINNPSSSNVRELQMKNEQLESENSRLKVMVTALVDKIRSQVHEQDTQKNL